MTFDEPEDSLAPAEDQSRYMATGRAVSTLDEDPDKAARALELERLTGVPAPVIHGDLDHFEDNTRTAITSQLIRHNPHIADYINRNPMASMVSNGDLDKLDHVSTSIKALPKGRSPVELDFGESVGGLAVQWGKDLFEALWDSGKSFVSIPKDITTDTIPFEETRKAMQVIRKEGASYENVAAYLGTLNNLFVTQIASGNPLDLQAQFHPVNLGAQDFVSGVVGAFGALTGLTPTVRLVARLGEEGTGVPKELTEQAAMLALLFLGLKEIPSRLSPVADKAKLMENGERVQKLDSALAQAEKSATRERDPELFADFVRQHQEGRENVLISVDAIKGIYGDSVPAPTDGKLGWIPNINEQIGLAEHTNGFIEVPIADLLAKLPRELFDKLRNDIKFDHTSLTETEATTPIKPVVDRPPIDSVETALREVAGIPPDVVADAAGRKDALATPEAKAISDDVAKDVRARGVFQADELLAKGTLFGQEVPKVVLDESRLTPEQKAGLPKEYYGKDGVAPDDLASQFGFDTGSEMVDALAAMHSQKAGKTTEAFVSEIAEAETAMRVATRPGALAESMHTVLSSTSMDALYAESGIKGPKAAIDAFIKDRFERVKISMLSMERFFAEAGKHAAVGDKVKQYLSLAFAQEARRLFNERKEFAKLAKRFEDREVKGVPQVYTDFIHDILMRLGQSIDRTPQDLVDSINGHGEGKSLRDFVEGKQSDLYELPVADFLLEPNFNRHLEDLTAGEFREANDSLTAMFTNAKMEEKITRAGFAADLKVVKKELIKQLETFAIRHYDAEGKRWLGPIPPSAAKVLRTYLASHLQLESILNRFDRGNPHGAFNQYVMRDLTTAANAEAALERATSAKILSIGEPKDLNARVENSLFIDPTTRGVDDTPIAMTRKNMLAVLLNAGNASNLRKMAQGYGLKPEQVKSWLDKVATKEDWEWAQKLGDVFKDLKIESDKMYRRLTGLAPESIEITGVATPHGSLPGWYYPIISHPLWEGKTKAKIGLEQDNYIRATTPAGYTKTRTESVAPVALSLDMFPNRMKQIIHDISFREAVINANKIFSDPGVRQAIAKHYGVEYRELLTPYLRDVANSANFRSDAEFVGTKALEYFRQNMIASLIGLNPGTVLKHTPTALLNSMNEVGPVNFAKAMTGLLKTNKETGESNWRFAMDTSEELGRRHQHYVETLTGAQQNILRQATLRENIIALGSKPVALGDLLSAVPTWLAQYEKSISDGASKGDAIYLADRAVRRAHGSTVITNRPGVMRTGPLGQWFASVYGFFSHILNRQYEMAWRANDALHGVETHGVGAGARAVPYLVGALMSYVIFPALIEELVTPLPHDKQDGWATTAAKGLVKGVSGSWIGVRDIAHGILSSRDPSAGLLSTAGQTIYNFVKDMKTGSEAWTQRNAGRTLRHTIAGFGLLTGLTNEQMGKWAQLATNYLTGREKPKSTWEWLAGFRYGTLRGHSRSFDEYKRSLGGH